MTVQRFEIATGGDPCRALLAVAATFTRPGVATVTVSHDDGCPCLDGLHPIGACTCELIVVELEARGA